MKNEIVAKKYGKNLVVVINGEKKTRVISTEKDKKDEELIKNKVVLYNKKNNKMLLEEILALVDTKKAEKEQVEAKKKGIKKAIKKESKTKEVKAKLKSTSEMIDAISKEDLTYDNIQRLEALLATAKKNTAKEAPAKTTVAPRRGEH